MKINVVVDKIKRSLTMAIGELLYEEKGKQTGIRVLESVISVPVAEISGLGSLKFEGI
jgi:hypothetical protein